MGQITIDQITQRVDRLLEIERPRYRRLWMYCRNPMRVLGVGASENSSDRPYRQAQEWGLPQRITGGCGEIARKEVVIENDIGWRIETMVDYLFGKPLVIESAATDADRRALISDLLRQILAHNGGILLLQQMALLGAVYGFVDVLVKLQPCEAGDDSAACGTSELGQPPSARSDLSREPAPRHAEPDPGATGSGLDDNSDARTRAASGMDSRDAQIARLARMVRIEVVEPARALPFLSCTDWREIEAYGQCWEIENAPREEVSAGRRLGWFDRLRQLACRGTSAAGERNFVVELITPTQWYRYENQKLTAQGENSLRRVPLVHVQNAPVPFEYAGLSDVEPLVPLQDELNTRLSDRANRITLQSFKMYLGKGIENFDSMPVSPGRMWTSDNDKADVIEFGGDASCPSEESHIADVREAMDKTSCVTPIAAGAIKDRIGNLTSAAALRVTLQALLAKTEKKRTTYGTAIGQICELALAWLDRAGLFATTTDERQIELNWPSPLPEDELLRLQEAQAKARLGVPKEVVLRELGY